MGLRQPSKTGAFFAQTAAGTQQQEEARKKLKQPQAIGGAASAGTGMVAAQTTAQQNVTGQVKEQTGQAASTMVAAPIKSATAEAIAPSGVTTPVSGTTQPPGTINAGPGKDTIAGGTPSAAQPAPASPSPVFARVNQLNADIKNAQDEIKKIESTKYLGFGGSFRKQVDLAKAQTKLSNLQDQLNKANITDIGELAKTGDVGAVEARGADLQTAITDVTAQINALDSKLTSANALDAKLINDEKTRLTDLLKSYQDKLTKENLGQMATTSNLEEELLTREKVLAQQGNDIGKLQELFGKGWDKYKRGALESQIYGKDLEAIQEAASAGLTAKERATREGEAALTGYTEQLDRSKKAFTEALDKDAKKLEILKMKPEELSGYTRKELTDLFGADQVNKLFKFASDDPKAAVTGTTASSTRQALVERSSKLTEELGKIAGAKTEAMGVKEKEFTTAEKQIFGDVNSGGGINTFKTVFNNMTNNANNVRSKINDITSSMFSREWKGISRDSSIADIISSESQKMQAELNKRAIQIEEARKQKNTALMKSLYDSYTNYSRQKQKELNDLWNSMSENARRL